MNRLATFGKLLGVSTSYRKNEVLNTRTQPVAGWVFRDSGHALRWFSIR